MSERSEPFSGGDKFGGDPKEFGLDVTNILSGVVEETRVEKAPVPENGKETSQKGGEPTTLGNLGDVLPNNIDRVIVQEPTPAVPEVAVDLAEPKPETTSEKVVTSKESAVERRKKKPKVRKKLERAVKLEAKPRKNKKLETATETVSEAYTGTLPETTPEITAEATLSPDEGLVTPVKKTGESEADILAAVGAEHKAEGVAGPEAGPAVTPETALPETAPTETKQENPLEELQRKDIKSITETYVEAAKIDSKTKKVIGEMLAEYAKDKNREFALRWFSKNEALVREKGIIIPPKVSDEWKINTVLGSPEKGGMGVILDGKDPEYKDIGDELEMIGILRIDIGKNQVPPKAPALLLNYLQGKFESAVADNRKDEQEKLFLLRKEIAETTMKEDISLRAEELAADKFAQKDLWVESRLGAKKDELYAKTAGELMEAEWQNFRKLQPSQRRKQQKELGIDLEIARDSFDRLTVNQNYTPEQALEAFNKYNHDLFCGGVIRLAQKNGIEGTAFYGMLANGYKPYGKQRSKGFFGGRILLPMKGGSTTEVSSKGYDAFVERKGADFLKTFESQARAELELTWNTDRENAVVAGIENRITEIAKSPETTIGRVKEMYQQARTRILLEFAAKLAESKGSRTDAERERTAREAGKEPSKTEKAPDTTINFVSDTYKDEDGRYGGELEGLTGEFDRDLEILSSYLKRLVDRDMTPKKLKGIIDRREGKQLYKESWLGKGGNESYGNGLFEWFKAIADSIEANRRKEAKKKEKKK